MHCNLVAKDFFGVITQTTILSMSGVVVVDVLKSGEAHNLDAQLEIRLVATKILAICQKSVLNQPA